MTRDIQDVIFALNATYCGSLELSDAHLAQIVAGKGLLGEDGLGILPQSGGFISPGGAVPFAGGGGGGGGGSGGRPPGGQDSIHVESTGPRRASYRRWGR